MDYYNGYGNPGMSGNAPGMGMPYNSGMGQYQTRNPGYQQPMGQQPVNQNQTTPQITYITRPVASVEEAKAVPTDFNGAVTIMTDFSHGMIYTKALNYQDGTSIFNCYRLDNNFLNPQPVIQAPDDYVPRAEFETLRGQFNNLVAQLNSMTTGGNANESENSNAAGRRKSNANASNTADAK